MDGMTDAANTHTRIERKDHYLRNYMSTPLPEILDHS